MAYESVKNQIDAYIKANGVNLITGPVLNAVLTTMLDELGEGYAFQGVLNTTDTPSPAADIPQAWLASAGTYLGGSITVDEGELALIIHAADGWSKETVYRGVQLSDEAIVAALGYTPADDADLAEKQDAIADLSAIRSGAALGSTSVQPVDIEDMVEAEPIGSIVPPVNPSEFATKVKLTKNGQPVFPVTDVSLVMGLQDAIKLPPVKVATLPTASADTAGKMYYVGPTDGEYERYITSAVNGSYEWIDLGNTAIPLPSIADNLTTDDANTALSAKQGVVLEGEISQLSQKIDGYDFGWTAGYINSNGVLTPPDGYSQISSKKIPASDANKIIITWENLFCVRIAYFNGDTIVSRTDLMESDRSPYAIQSEYAIRITLATRYNGTTYTTAEMLEHYSFNVSEGLEQRVSKIESDLSTVSQELYGITADVRTIADLDVALVLRANMFYDTSGATAIGGTYSPSGSGQYNGCYCVKSSISEGERIKIRCNSNPNYFRGYVITDADNKITRLSGSGRVDEVIVATAEEKNIYINLWQFNEDTDGVWRIDTMSISPIVRQVGTDYADSWTIASGSPLSHTIYGDFGGKCVEFELNTTREQYAYVLLYYYIDGVQQGINPINIVFGERRQVRFPEGVDRILLYNYSTLTAETSFSLKYSFAGTVTEPLYRRTVPNDDLSGVNIVCFGDSITEFVDLSTYKTIPDYIMEFSGANIISAAIGGTQWRTRTTPVDNPTTSQEAYAALDISELVHSWVNNEWTNVDAAVAFLAGQGDDNNNQIKRLKATPVSDVDAVVIMMGTNDYINSQAIGTISDNDAATSMGAMNKVITALLTANQALHIYLFTNKVLFYNSVQTDANWCENYVNGQGVTLPQFNQKIKDIAEKYNLPVCDMIETVGWNQINYPYFCPEGDLIHPQANGGFRVLAERMWAFIVSNRTF